MRPNEAPANYLDLGGTIRHRTATATLAQIRPLLPKFGITRVADITGLDCIGIPVYVCIRANSKDLAAAQGKGITPELAEISAIMESIEGYHSENPRDADLFGSYSALSRSYRLLDPMRLVPGAFPTTALRRREMGWIKGNDLITGEEVYVPHVSVCLDTTRPHSEYALLSASSTGLASGNHFTEVVCHALYEVIERDANARWVSLLGGQKKATRVNLETIEGLNRQLLDCFKAAEVEVRVWEITSALGIPAFRCTIRDRDVPRGLGQFGGMGAHLSSDIALSRALTEAAQSRLAMINGSRDDVLSESYQTQCLSTYTPAPDFGPNGPTPFSLRAPQGSRRSFAGDIKDILERLVVHGFGEVLVVDHTKPEFDVPVVHVFAPGMLDLRI
jgi:YcaO-like protein with predicted kinase domain